MRRALLILAAASALAAGTASATERFETKILYPAPGFDDATLTVRAGACIPQLARADAAAGPPTRIQVMDARRGLLVAEAYVSEGGPGLRATIRATLTVEAELQRFRLSWGGAERRLVSGAGATGGWRRYADLDPQDRRRTADALTALGDRIAGCMTDQQSAW